MTQITIALNQLAKTQHDNLVVALGIFLLPFSMNRFIKELDQLYTLAIDEKSLAVVERD